MNVNAEEFAKQTKANIGSVILAIAIERNWSFSQAKEYVSYLMSEV